jgi:hypothetical protein
MPRSKGYELDPDVNIHPDKLDSGDIPQSELIFDVVRPEDVEGEDVEPVEVPDGD